MNLGSVCPVHPPRGNARGVRIKNFTAKGTYRAFERSYTHSRRCDNLEVLAVLMEELLESFVTAGLGLTLVSRIQEVNQLPEVQIRPTKAPPAGAQVCAAWRTTQGRVIICATYNAEHSRRMRAPVLWLEWWIPPHIHHEGWWRVEPKWPRDWIKGPGTHNA
jgi:DNA-binding transcriptional LysR family regulator